jgi:hypothetical protein
MNLLSKIILFLTFLNCYFSARSLLEKKKAHLKEHEALEKRALDDLAAKAKSDLLQYYDDHQKLIAKRLEENK